MSALLHGKLPAHGDFVSRGLPVDERDLVDEWLAASLAAARDTVGARFEDAFDAAPPWRFAWHDGDRWTAGALAPSADAVGRRYPILVGRRDLPADGIEAATAALDDLLYAAVAEGWDADRLAREAEAVAVAAGDQTPDQEGWWTVALDGSRPATLAGARPAGLMTAMLKMGQIGA